MSGLRILGVDPGSRITGYALLDVDGQRLAAVDYGVVRTTDSPFAERLGEIFSGLSEVIAQGRPACLAIENVFVHRNAGSALKLGQARGAAICAAVQAGLPVSEYSPSEIKQAVVGTGRADKAQVQHMVSALLGLKAQPRADAADALAVAVCHGHVGATRARMRIEQRTGR